MKRRCPCAQIETLIGLMPGEREFERVTRRVDGGSRQGIVEGTKIVPGLWYCTSCGTVVFIPEEKS